MALDSYDGLKEEIANWLVQAGVADFEAVIPTFIRMFEVRANRKLRHRAMVKRATALVEDQFVPLPVGWLEAINVQVNAQDPQPLEYKAMDFLDEIRGSTSTGQLRYYTIVANTIELVPTPVGTTEIEMVYYEKIPSLSGSNQTNWLLGEAPDVYLFGSLMNAELYGVNDERVTTWATAMSEAMDALTFSSTTAMHSGSGLVARPRRALGVK